MLPGESGAFSSRIKLGYKEQIDNEQVGTGEPFIMTRLLVYFMSEVNKLAIVNNFEIPYFRE